MPKGPKGEKRPADVIGAAIAVAKIATGEEEEERDDRNPSAVARGHVGGLKGGAARASTMSPARRKAIAQLAAKKRWDKPK
jgi:hypothetical protein